MNFTLVERIIHKMEKASKDLINQKKSKDYVAGFNSALKLVKWFKEKADDKFEKEARELFVISDKEIERNKGIYEKLDRNRRRRV
ncbi:hypothetical protein PMY35_15360 [Clostridium tertium]|jgi:hypothetical protein|uniref:hypothetical protein n=1 Tax=Clostridium tertium TaxID=1559 RepID=UPI00189DD529|nr:hypothetical protein [Clostridium tertium]MDB1949197.1 hypothetical protein [Clostridium tertium]